MKLLLDTHTALWWVNEHEKLSLTARTALLDEANTLLISIVSAWEIAVKVSLGKMTEFDGGVNQFLSQMEAASVIVLPILPQHIEIVETLPFIHRDPFDRLLVATVKAESMTILTADNNISKYDVSTMW